MSHFIIHKPILLMGLLLGMTITGGLGFWFVFHPPVIAAALPTPVTTPKPTVQVAVPSATSIPTRPKPKEKRPTLTAAQGGAGNTQAVQDGHDNQQASSGTGGVSQVMKDSPGGVQVGRDVNLYGVPNPPPQLNVIRQKNIVGRPGFPLETPGVEFIFRVEGEFVNPQFKVTCDRPCVPEQIMFSSNGGADWSLHDGNDNPSKVQISPTVVKFTAGNKRTFSPNEVALAIVRSVDGEKITARLDAYSDPPRGTGKGIIGARGENKVDDVHVSGFDTGMDFSNSQSLDMKHSDVDRNPPQPAQRSTESPK